MYAHGLIAFAFLAASAVVAQPAQAVRSVPIVSPDSDPAALRIGPRNHCTVAYPESQQSREQAGWVLLRFTVDKVGTVQSLSIVDSSPPRIFDAAALSGFSVCRFDPETPDGKLVVGQEFQVVVTFNPEGP
jgi:TonB family protein